MGEADFELMRDTAVERCTRGDLAGMARLLCQALAATDRSHLMARRSSARQRNLGDPITSLQADALGQLVEHVSTAEHAAEIALRDVLAATPLLARSYRPRLRAEDGKGPASFPLR